ncbi:MAG: HYR domain-containing protein, partial [Saprospiraceae bacterium]|nr:HYR domain-containing protein [Saprospiraceae bacterium]
MKKSFTQILFSLVAKRVSAPLTALALALWSIPTAYAQLNYVATACFDPYVVAATQPGTTFVGSGDDVLYTLALPFPFTFYTTTYPGAAGAIGVNTNGFIIFNPATNRGFTNANLPTATAGAAMYPFWDDLQANPAINPNSGIYTRVDGTAPNRIFTIEWYQIGHFSHTANQEVTFQVRLFENGNRIQFRYQDVIFGGSQSGFDNGLSATIGLEDIVATPRPFTLVGFNTASVTNGQCIEFVLPQACNPIAGPTLNFNTAPGLCSANATIALPTFNPPGCANGITVGLRYNVNGGPFTTVALPASSITITLPKGSNVIVWQTFIVANGATAGVATQIVNVNDNEPPKLNCPQNIIVNLNPGECCRNIIWAEPTATDNCPFLQGPFQLNTINLGGNAGSVGGVVFFDINNTSGQPIVITNFGMNISAGTVVNIYTKAGTHVGFETNAAAWTLSGTADANTGPFSGPFPGNGTITPAPVTTPAGGLTLGPGLWGIALHTPTAQQNYTNGNGANQTYSDANITLNLGSAANTLWGAPFTPRVWNGFVRYQIGGPAQVLQTAGPANGSLFCKDASPFTIRYQVADASGNTATCSFTITVNPFPNPVNSLTCNNNVQISLKADCSAFVNADQVLEGGPYKCYDDYVVEVDKTLPFGNGPWIRVSQGPAFPGFGVPTPLGPDDVGKTYQVRVTDPATGNRCWGYITVEDKLPPVLSCQESFVPCNDATKDSAEPFEPCADPLTVLPAAPLFTINTANNGNASGGMVFFNITNNTSLPLEITAIGMNISGPTTVNIYARPGTHVGFETNASAWTLVGSADGNTGPFSGPFPGNGTITPCPLATPITLPPGTFGIGLHTVSASSNYTNGTGANQTYTDGTITLNLGSATNAFFAAPVFSPRVWNGFVQYKKTVPPTCLPNGLTLNVNAFKIAPFTYRVPRGAGTPVMEPCSDVTLTYSDISSAAQPCSSPNIRVITRRWVARDASGNSATCTQRINVLRPKTTDLTLPPSYDDIDKPSISCAANAYPTPEWLQASGRQGFPLVFGKPDGCDFGWSYTDTRVNVCDGTYKIRRQWSILNWCTGQKIEHIQIIKVSDMQAPTFNCPANLTVGTDPFQCCATVDLPDVIVTDNCSRIKSANARIL